MATIHGKSHNHHLTTHQATVKVEAVAAEVQPRQEADANKVGGGLGRLIGAKTQPLGPLPWETQTQSSGGWANALREAFTHQFVQTDAQKTQAFMDKYKGKFDKSGQELLQKLQASGKLEEVDHGMHNLRDNIERFLQNGGNPGQAEHILKLIDNPDKIQQVNNDTCAAATLEKTLAMQNPAKFFQIMGDLAIKGKAEFDGNTMTVTRDNQHDILKHDHLGHHRLDSMFQAAAMDMANGSAKYDVGTDNTEKTVGEGKHKKEETQKGLTVEQASKLSEALLGTPMTDPDKLNDKIQAGQAAGQTRTDVVKTYLENHTAKSLAEDHPGLLVALANGHKNKAHMVLITGVANGMVSYTDGNGKPHTMSEDKFASRVTTNENVHVGETGNLTTTQTSSGWAGAVKTFTGF